MKVYSISKWTFFGICLLILTLPLSRQWRLILAGEKATGMVTEFTMIVHENVAGEREILYVSEVEFKAEGKIQKAYGPSGYEYDVGRSIPLRYNSSDPSENCLLTFSGIYLNGYLVVPIVLLTVWAAFYLSFNSYSKKRRRSRSTEGTFSPYKARKKTHTPGSILFPFKRGIGPLLILPLIGTQLLNYPHAEASMPPLPSDQKGLELFPSLQVARVKTNCFNATVTAYSYKDPKGSRSKYMFRPMGGELKNRDQKKGGLQHF